jgi:sensor domain CHASE-containing protein
MTIQLRMQLHMLVYNIVSLRMAYGNYEDSTSIRTKLEAEIKTRIRRLQELEEKSELEVAQTLLELYQEKFQARAPIKLTIDPHRAHSPSQQ